MILVTGGLGYIGSHTLVELIEANEEVLVLDNLSNSKEDVLNRIEEITKVKPIFYEGDIRDIKKLEEIFSTYTIKAVIHFAGLKAVGESVINPIDYYDSNVVGSLQLLKCMKKYQCKKIVFSSSATVYGNNPNVPFVEDYSLSTTNPYGTTKRMIEEILNDIYVSDKEWSIVILRYFNPIGAHKSGLIGEDPNDVPNNLLPYVAKVASGQLDYLSVFGNDYDTSDGTGVRDYIHVGDLACGHLQALKHIRKYDGYEIINLGTGIGYSVLEIVNAFERASQRKINYKIRPRRPGDVGTSYACVDKAKKILDWSAKYGIDRMCQDTWRFENNYRK